MANPVLKSIEVAFRRALLQTLSLAGRAGSRKTSGLAPEDIIRQFGNSPSILLMRQDRLGDVIMSTFLMVALRRKYPESRIAILLGKNNEAIETLLPEKYEIFVYRKHLVEDIKTIREIRRQHFDIAIDLTDKASVTSSFLISMLGARIRLGFKKENSVIYDIAVERPDQERVHVAARTMELLRPFGIDPSRIDLSPQLNLECVRIKGRVGFNVSARVAERCAPVAASAAIVRALLELGVKELLIFVSPNDRQRGEDIVRESESSQVQLSETATLLEFAQQIGTCEYLITTDTATLQIGAAAKIPMVILFNPTPGEHYWTPQGVPFESHVQLPQLSALEPQPVIALFQRLLERTASTTLPHTQPVDASQTL